MKTNTIRVNTRGENMQDALAESEKVGNSCGLSREELLRLRLLSEELFGMIRSITGDVSADYWIEYEGKSFNIHLRADVNLTQEMYNHLVDVASNGKNSAVRGFMSSIKSMVAVMLLPQSSSISAFSIGIMSLGIEPTLYAGSGAYIWSMNQYRTGLENENMIDVEDARDELEKSIVANLSDEVIVSIEGTTAEIVISKSFK